ncbi:THO complex subunit 4B-like [Abrus precatorius]|uniref:THO complex subunit 4B-like n=1 Tax=Abrus precatorius TaxID=3816 RepID=A0A8B8L7Z5_ABRPR|nr:THO complex subunit 4B-like [Abrus precatorius]
MAAGMDMSLDDLIKRSSAAVAARRRSNHSGPERRFTVHNAGRTTPYGIPQVRQVWQQSMVTGMVLGEDGATKTESGAKLYISNLDYGVSNEDIKLLFAEEGELKRYSVHYDKSGRSKGTAEVVFVRQSDALAAIRKYNNMRLDGKPLQIELVGTSLVNPTVVPLGQSSLLGKPNDDVIVSERGRVGGSRFHSGIGKGHLPRDHIEEDDTRKTSFGDLDHNLERYHRFPRGHAEVKGHTRKVSVKDLDDDLERYHLEAMQKKNGK